MNLLHGIYTHSYMSNYIVHYMNNYRILHDILHGITWNYMEFVLVPTSWTRLRRQDLRLAPRRRVHAGAGRRCRGLGVHSTASFLVATAARGTNHGVQLVWGLDEQLLRPF